MVTNFNLESHIEDRFTQNISDLIYSFNREISGLGKNYVRESFIRQILERDDSSFVKQCNLYLLVDQLLEECENGKNGKRKSLATVADNLLNARVPERIAVAPSSELAAQNFIEKVIEKADETLNENTSFESKASAQELRNSVNELLGFFSKTWGKIIPGRFVSFHKFFASWEKFAEQYLRKRIDSLQD